MSNIERIILDKYATMREHSRCALLDETYIDDNVLLGTKLYCVTEKGQTLNYYFELSYAREDNKSVGVERIKL